MTRPPTMTEAQARHILANPTPHTRPLLIRLAWFVLKSARGQAVYQTGLRRLAR